MKPPQVNITPVERVARVFVGLAIAIGGVILLAAADAALAIALEGLLVLAGLPLIVTGTLGHCPLHRKPGYMPRSLGRNA